MYSSLQTIVFIISYLGFSYFVSIFIKNSYTIDQLTKNQRENTLNYEWIIQTLNLIGYKFKNG